jgi:hypothetical protein
MPDYNGVIDSMVDADAGALSDYAGAIQRIVRLDGMPDYNGAIDSMVDTDHDEPLMTQAKTVVGVFDAVPEYGGGGGVVVGVFPLVDADHDEPLMINIDASRLISVIPKQDLKYSVAILGDSGKTEIRYVYRIARLPRKFPVEISWIRGMHTPDEES